MGDRETERVAAWKDVRVPRADSSQCVNNRHSYLITAFNTFSVQEDCRSKLEERCRVVMKVPRRKILNLMSIRQFSSSIRRLEIRSVAELPDRIHPSYHG